MSAYWVPQDSPAHETTLIYVISHASREAAKASWAAFVADPEWKKVSEASQVDGKIVERIESVFMDATDYSPRSKNGALPFAEKGPDLRGRPREMGASR